jgi:hypothetical protein
MNKIVTLSIIIILFSICTQRCTGSSANHKPSEEKKDSASKGTGPIADAATIMSRQQVPILCYHHIRDIKMPNRSSMGYEVTAAAFREQMKILSDSGYHSIVPDQLYEYLVHGTALPSKPVMITFDDTDEEQITIGKTEMDKYGFKGVYFIMNISIGRDHYMTREQIKQLSNEGHVIACHTYDHHRVDKYKYEDTVDFQGQKKKVNDWDFQLRDTKKVLDLPIHLASGMNLPFLKLKNLAINWHFNCLQKEIAQSRYIPSEE